MKGILNSTSKTLAIKYRKLSIKILIVTGNINGNFNGSISDDNELDNYLTNKMIVSVITIMNKIRIYDPY